MATPGSRFLAEAGALLRPGGRLLVIHDYGRDDVWGLLPAVHERQVAWSQRNGPFLGDGFRIRVIHCWWTFEAIEQARDLLGAAFGDAGVEVAEKMKRLRLEYSIAVYHRSAPGGLAAVGTAGEAGAASEVGSGGAEAGGAEAGAAEAGGAEAAQRRRAQRRLKASTHRAGWYALRHDDAEPDSIRRCAAGRAAV